MRVDVQPAYILHHYAYRDTSQIIELFTRDYGRLSVISRGTRSAKSKLKSILQVFRPLHVSWSGKGDLPSLTMAESAEARMPQLSGKALPSAFYLNELLMRLLHRHDVHDDIFNLYHHTLFTLAETDQLEVTLRLFEKQLLNLLGFGINLDTDAESGEPIVEDGHYVYYIEHGPVALKSDEQQQLAHHLVIKGRSLLSFDRDKLETDAERKEVKSLMRLVLSYYLGEKPLKSRELFR
ncbi:MAG TPA: DNA repair protein RecO [Gammaproteobacteria bacterium]